MSDSTSFSPDLPELRIVAQFAGIAPSRLAAALNSPEHFMEHVTLEQLNRWKESMDRLSAVQVRMLAAVDVAITHARKSQ